MFSTLTTLLGLATAVFAATIDVKVGDGGLVFDPNSVTAQVGDSVRFQFYSGRGSHSVVLSSFDTPCQPATDGFYSGIIQGNQEGNHTFTISITSTSPQWYYCSVGSHCQSGMVGVINPPAASPSNDGQDITAFASAAQAVLRQTPPGSIQGGVIATDDSSPSPSSAPSSSGSGLTPASPRPSLTASTTTAGGETVTSSGTSTTGGSSTGPVSTTTSGSGSASASSSGASTTAPPSGTGTGTEAGSSETAATTTTSGGRRSEWSVVLWLSVILGGLVALMA